MRNYSTYMSQSNKDSISVQDRFLGTDRRTSLRYLGISLVIFVVIFGIHLFMHFFNLYLVPIGPSTAVIIVGIGLLASALAAYWNNGLIISIFLSISPLLSLVTAVEFLELTYPRAPFWMLANTAIAIGFAVGVLGYLLGIVVAWAE